MPFRRRSWYPLKMITSWIAIVNRQGLRLLVLETPHALPFMLKRAARENAVCFWAVLHSEQAAFVEALRQSGNPQAALKWMEYLAREVGRIIPSEPLSDAQHRGHVTYSDGHDMEWNC